ncbi:helix-turn-helix domain-containing protein [Fructobacillus parabroussonetiae]|uniref:Helix-turn-helix domain-containing protein n=1 Tax=Fructobacillus parabroussonetiae TaxID=2713174 RepID=A0ABS5QVI1_9LACO|nr:helix-turn-helix transcriptional regulator [Fructobacillus parabroussonetiae]MBS9337209.1 helix-turn-helix domain-containing protein [Fructobacillus parabroussonetiae]
MPVISNDMAKAIKRQRGELNLKVSDLAEQTNLSRFTLYRVLNGTGEYVTDKTYNALNEWLYQKL